MSTMESHNCREGGNIGLMLASQTYPYVATYCEICRREMRRIPIDDLPDAWMDLAFDMIEVIQAKRKAG